MNSGRVDQWSHCVESRYVSSASGTDISTATEASSLDCHFCGVDSPPACGEMVVENPWSRVGHTHTHTLVDVHTELKAVPHAGAPIPKNTRVRPKKEEDDQRTDKLTS